MTLYTFTPDLLPTALALLVTVLMAGNTLHRTGDALQRAFLGVLVGVSVWLLGDLLSLSAEGAQARWDWGLVQFFGILTVPVGWLALVQRHLRPVPEPLPWPRLLALLATPLLTLLLVWTNDRHGLIWRFPEGWVPTWGEVDRQPLYWLLVAGYPNALLVWGVALLLPAWRFARGHQQTHLAVLLLAAGLSSVANTAFLLGAALLPGGASPAPVVFALCLMPIAWTTVRYGLLQVAPLAHRQVVEQLADAVFVLDNRGRILEANDRAARLAGRPAADLRGEELPDVFGDWPPLNGEPAEWRPGRGDEVWELRLSTVRGGRGQLLGQAVVARDVTARAEEHARVQRLASEDSLTGLGNRRAFEVDLAQETAWARRHGSAVAVAIIDLDGLKAVNDGQGHAAGDELLAAFGRAVRTAFRPEDRAYRIGGDEFALLLSPSAPEAEASVQERITRTVRRLQSRGFPGIGASVGVAIFPDEGEALIRLADERMYAQKAQHRAARGAKGNNEQP